MKATMEIPDELYREVKARSALEGRPVRAVAVELFRRYVKHGLPSTSERSRSHQAEPLRYVEGEPIPTWFGIARKPGSKVRLHDMDAIRESIGRGIAENRGR